MSNRPGISQEDQLRLGVGFASWCHDHHRADLARRPRRLGLGRRGLGFAGWNKVDFDLHAHGGGDPAEHGERVAVVVGVLQAADDRRGGPDPRGRLALGEPGLGPEPVDLAGDLGVGDGPFEGGDPLGVVAHYRSYRARNVAERVSGFFFMVHPSGL